MLYLIKCKPSTSREELVAHWFANHMPSVIQAQHERALKGKPHARRYIVTLYNPNKKGEHHWDGMAQMWWDRPLPKPEVPHGTVPSDSFQQKIEPYRPWASKEYVVMDGSWHLKVEPLILNAPFPYTRSGFYKVSSLAKVKEGTDFDRFYSHWLNTHVSNVSSIMDKVGGFRYVVSHSIDPQAELYVGWRNYISTMSQRGHSTEKPSSQMTSRNGSIQEPLCWEGELK